MNPSEIITRALAASKARDAANAEQTAAEENERRLVREREYQASDPVKRRQQIIDETWAACVAAVPDELKQEIEAKRAEYQRCDKLWRDAVAELQTLKAGSPEDVDSIPEYARRAVELQMSLPHYQRFRDVAKDAYESARGKSQQFLFAEYGRHSKSYSERLLAVEKECRERLDQAKSDMGAVGTLMGRCSAGLG